MTDIITKLLKDPQTTELCDKIDKLNQNYPFNICIVSLLSTYAYGLAMFMVNNKNVSIDSINTSIEADAKLLKELVYKYHKLLQMDILQ